MKYSENSLNVLTAISYNNIGTAWIVDNIKGKESEEEIVALLNKKSSLKIDIEDFINKKNEIEDKLYKLGNSCDGLVAFGDKDFPLHRGNVSKGKKPVFLFYKGDLNLLYPENNNISVIGLLTPDESIEERERKIVQELIKHDITIVSGLAFGCDSIAHHEAIKGGKTIAILPSPLNNILPARNRGLANEILDEGGLLISEYYEDFNSRFDLSKRYKDRDRLQAMFCDAIFLIASYAPNSAQRWNITNKKLDSGARLAMEDAKKFGIDRAVMYNPKTDTNNPMFDLNRELLEDENVLILTNKNLDMIIHKIKNKYKKSSNSNSKQKTLPLL